MVIQHNVHSEALQSEKANTHLGPGKKGQHERMSVYFGNNLFNYRHLSIADANEKKITESTGQKRMCDKVCVYIRIHTHTYIFCVYVCILFEKNQYRDSCTYPLIYSSFDIGLVQLPFNQIRHSQS